MQNDNESNYKYYDFVMAGFVTVLLISNILSSAKIIDLDSSIAGIPLLFDAGTLIFPISYIFGDILTEVYGYSRARRVIWAGFSAMALLAFFVWLAGELPAESGWTLYAGDSAYSAILGGVSGLFVASVIAYWLGEFANSFVLAKLKIATAGKYLWIRTIGSTLVGQALDTTVFFLIASWLGVFPVELLLSLIVTNYILKVGIEVLLTPFTILSVNVLKQVESVDVYDINTRFNPFTFSG